MWHGFMAWRSIGWHGMAWRSWLDIDISANRMALAWHGMRHAGAMLRMPSAVVFCNTIGGHAMHCTAIFMPTHAMPTHAMVLALLPM